MSFEVVAMVDKLYVMTTLQQREPGRAISRSTASGPATIRASVTYLQPTRERPVNYLYQPPAGTPRESCTYEPRVIDIHDGRADERGTIDRQGFELHDAPTRAGDLLDADQVMRVYYPELAELARHIAGGTHAYVFDHLVRMREPGRPPMTFGKRGASPYPSAAGRVHNDYTHVSGQRRLGVVLNDPRAEAAVTRFCIVTLWRSITDYPVLDTPLAMCDATTVAPGDLVAGDIRYRDRTGEIYLATYSAQHRWCYFPAMMRNEVLVFKQYDSAGDVTRFTLHAAFDHPDASPGAPPRRSIEARCLVTYT